ncbi:MAG: phytoene desaturase [Cyclobacteriaceae bacterium]
MGRAVVIGSGFAGLSAACFMAREGWDVTVIEKNDQPGGRARKLELEGYTFDMGPSWYWMPDVFDRFFEQFGKRTSDYYSLKRLDPSYGVKFSDSTIDIPADMQELEQLFESIEQGSAEQLRKFLKQAAFKYEVGIKRLVHKPGRSLTEFLEPELIKGIVQMDVFNSMKTHVSKFFKDERLRSIMEFPVLFLGAKPENTPALYSLMNHADLTLGTWYPERGMYSVVEAMFALALELGVRFEFNQEVKSFRYDDRRITKVVGDNKEWDCEVVIGGADYHHLEQRVLSPQYRQYSPRYWNKRTLAPSSLLFYIGVEKKLPNLHHHTLFFDEDFDHHAIEIYDDPQWPSKPLLYVSATSKTDEFVAPQGCENLVVLIPVAPDLDDTDAIRGKYFDQVIDRLEAHTGVSIRDSIVVKRSFAHRDFVADYHSFKGNAYGLANTLRQTAVLKPSLKNKHLDNLYFTGQLTVPGPGVPPSLISGEVVAKEILKENQHHHEYSTV